MCLLCTVPCKIFHRSTQHVGAPGAWVESVRELCLLCRVACKVFHMHIQHGIALQAVCKVFVSKAELPCTVPPCLRRAEQWQLRARAEQVLQVLCTCFNVDSGTCTLLTGECIYILNACGCIKPGMCPWRRAPSHPVCEELSFRPALPCAPSMGCCVACNPAAKPCVAAQALAS